MRTNGRKNIELRDVKIETNISKNAEGSCLIHFGYTKVLCTATIEENVPRFLRGKNQGWISAEYSMLPRATHSRVKRESTTGKQSGRTLEIQRLIARSLRAAIDLRKLGERQIIIDCDVIEADGGTRTAAITGGFVALSLACNRLLSRKTISSNPIITNVAAISCGIVNNNIVVDLDYKEDSSAEVDANFILNSEQKIIEIQGTAEKSAFSQEELLKMLNLATNATKDLITLQNASLE